MNPGLCTVCPWPERALARAVPVNVLKKHILELLAVGVAGTVFPSGSGLFPVKLGKQ